MIKDILCTDDGQVRPVFAIGIIALVIGGAGYWAYSAWTSGNRPIESVWMCTSPECGCMTEFTPKLGDTLPAECPKCGQKTLVPAYRCPACKEFMVLNEYRGLKPPTRCPKCGKEVWYGQ